MRGIDTEESRVTLRVVLVRPPAGVDYGFQEGRGADYRTILAKRGDGQDVTLECSPVVKYKDNTPQLAGPLVQGPPAARFLYVDVGQAAGQADCCWSRRMKVPLKGIDTTMLKQALVGQGRVLEARVQGTAKDGGPACATVPLLDGWSLIRK